MPLLAPLKCSGLLVYICHFFFVCDDVWHFPTAFSQLTNVAGNADHRQASFKNNCSADVLASRVLGNALIVLALVLHLRLSGFHELGLTPVVSLSSVRHVVCYTLSLHTQKK